MSIVVALGALLADTRTPARPRSPARPTTPSPRAPTGSRPPATRGRPASSASSRTPASRPGCRRSASGPPSPHYVSQPPSPRATVALLQRVEEVLELTVPLGALPEQADDWVKTVDEMANEDAEVVEYVRSLEERATEVDLSQANGDQIAREFERYLRRRGSEAERRRTAPTWAPRVEALSLTAWRRGQGTLPARGRGLPQQRRSSATSRRRRRAGRASSGRTGRSSPTRSRRPG